ncbi:peptide-methionine (S)-S-oxide reductase [bacterium]|nr:peptide-methionine (S)-S-oxide reductase [candidate division CSSED10-310 bacterium]
MEGVIRTRVGYAGGSTGTPTYRNLGDHTETYQVDFDPSIVTYERLLEEFWKSHDPVGRVWSRQYRSVIFFHSEEQRRLAEVTKQAQETRRGRSLNTVIEPFTVFHPAEDYHQKYRLRNERALVSELLAAYPEQRGFMNSTAAARINGFLSGFGDHRRLRREIAEYGLSEAGQELLLRRTR